MLIRYSVYLYLALIGLLILFKPNIILKKNGNISVSKTTMIVVIIATLSYLAILVLGSRFELY